MKFWPFFRRHQGQGEDLDDALRQADRALIDAKQLRCRADEVGDRLSRTRERNHFGEAVVQSIRGRHP